MSAAADRLRLVSHFPGRLRVRAETFRVLPEVAEEVAERLLEEPGVSAVKLAPVTGSLVVTYDCRALQLPRIIQLLIRIGGLHGLQVDAHEDWTKRAEQGVYVREAFGDANDAIRAASKGKVDLKVAVPGALAGMGVGMLLAGKFVMPFWYDFMFWSFVTFTNMNPRQGSSATHASPQESDRRERRGDGDR